MLKNNKVPFKRNRTFKRIGLVYQELDTVTIDGDRHYIAPIGNGIPLPSVTTVLGRATDKEFLKRWRARVGEAEAEKVKVKAGRRGTAIHSIAEAYMLNEECYPEDTTPANIQTFAPIQRILDSRVGRVIGIEVPLYSMDLRTAGRTDCVAEFDGVGSVVDFKTSLKTKKREWIENYFLQATCYSMMFEDMFEVPVPQIAIVIAVDNEPDPQVFVESSMIYRDKVREVFATHARIPV
jgi:genome maintenance exonuclease 1